MNTRSMDWNVEKRCITWLSFVLNGLHFIDLYFEMNVMAKRRIYLKTYLLKTYLKTYLFQTMFTNSLGIWLQNDINYFQISARDPTL